MVNVPYPKAYPVPRVHKDPLSPFWRNVKRAAAEVATWPEWKQSAIQRPRCECRRDDRTGNIYRLCPLCASRILRPLGHRSQPK